MIPGFDRERFVDALRTHLSATKPIQSQEYLYGRDAQLRQIEQALCAVGRSIFIYGERGVGKTSLAQTVAYSHQSATHNPVLLACTPETTFADLMQRLLRHLARDKDGSVTRLSKIDFKFIGFEVVRKPEDGSDQIAALDLNDVVHALQKAAERRSGTTVVVIDEFDRIASDAERGHFADLIKQIGDQSISIRFVFCGVADTLDRLLGAHESCYRYLAGISLPRLGWEARYEIIDGAASALGVAVSDHPRFRIAAISDGFPHYVHLVSEKLFWELFNDEKPVSTPTRVHYQAAVGAAVLGIEQHLKKTYDKATIRGSGVGDHKEVLWSVADHADLMRNTSDIYESYCRIASNRDGDLLDRTALVSRLSALKTESCGQILTSERRGWYQYREGMMRGYVRLRAEEQGVELAVDYAAGGDTRSSWRQRSARRVLRWRPPEDIYE